MTQMAGNTLDIRTYHFSEAEGLVFDTNIWILLYGPGDPTDPRVTVYSESFLQILNASCQIHLDILVLGEFINRLARLEHELLKDHDASVPEVFKKFRDTPRFVPIATSICVAAKKVLNHCCRVDSRFPEIAIEPLLEEFAKGSRDLNDQVLAELCKSQGYKLVTDDGDFTFPEVTVITANRKLLRK
jgi:predicted nucleic acid-binding protein